MPFAFLNVTEHSGTGICIFNSHERQVCHTAHTAATVFTREKSKGENNRGPGKGQKKPICYLAQPRQGLYSTTNFLCDLTNNLALIPKIWKVS